MNGGNIAAILVGFFGLVSGITAALLSSRAQRNSAKADETAAAFQAYDDLFKNQNIEIERLRNDVIAARDEARDEEQRLLRMVNAARDDAQHAEQRCRECQHERAELLADLSALRAIVVDEVARAAAGQAIARHTELTDGDDLTDAERAELQAIRHFINRLPRGETEDP